MARVPISGIYAIVNTAHNPPKMFVGKSKDIQQRWWQHKSALRRGKHHSQVLQRAWDKCGEDAEDTFVFEILEECPEEQIHSREEYWIEQMYSHYSKNGYNIIEFEQPRRIIDESTRRKISEARKGYKASEETRRRMSKAMKGRKNSEETLQKILERLPRGTEHHNPDYA